jgi:hypothetical protein
MWGRSPDYTCVNQGGSGSVHKGDLFENPLLGKAFALAVLLGPLLLLPSEEPGAMLWLLLSRYC